MSSVQHHTSSNDQSIMSPFSSINQGNFKSSGQKTSFLQTDLQNLLNFTSQSNQRGIIEILDQYTQEKQKEASFLSNQKDIQIQNIIDLIGQGGWNALHYAIFCNQPNLVELFIQKGANVNQLTHDGWSPLQLAVSKNFIQIIQLITNAEGLNINELTSRGTALHIACMEEKLEVIRILLQNGADANFQDDQGDSCLDLDISPEVNQLLKTITDKQVSNNSPQIIENFEVNRPPPLTYRFQPPKPPIVRGNILQTTTFYFGIKQRYIVIDPDAGTIIRYQSKAQYPLKPQEIIPLQFITYVQMIPKDDYAVYMKQKYSYWEFFHTERQIIACQHEETSKKWIAFLYQAAVYSLWLDQNPDAAQEEQRKQNDVVELVDAPNETSAAAYLKQYMEFIKPNINNNAQGGSNKQDSEENQLIVVAPQSPRLENNYNGANGTNVLQEANQDNSKKVNNEENGSQKPSMPSPPQVIQKSPDEEKALNKKEENSVANNKGQDQKKSNQNKMKEDIEDLNQLTLNTPVGFRDFKVLQTLGSGAFGQVYLVKQQNTGAIYAMKALKKRNLIIKKQLRYAVTEANVLKTANSPFILGLHFTFQQNTALFPISSQPHIDDCNNLQTPNYLYLVLDYCPGGDLSYHLANQNTFEQPTVRFYISELILAIEHLHEIDVIYRDLKPENILLGEDGHIKLADFGLSKDGIQDGDKTQSFCGSPAYLSPQMLSQKGVGKASDLYGIGAVMYEMLVGEPPYYSDDIQTMYKNIKQGYLRLPQSVSDDSKDLIKQLLDRNPLTRIGANNKDDLKNHPFFQSIDWNQIQRKEYKAPVMEQEDSGSSDDDFDVDGDDDDNQGLVNDIDYDESNAQVNRVINFSFVRNNKI